MFWRLIEECLKFDLQRIATMYKKSIFLISLVSVLCLVAATANAVLIGHYEFDDGPGDVTADTSKYAPKADGTLGHASRDLKSGDKRLSNPKWVKGKIGGALQFNGNGGNGNYVVCGNHAKYDFINRNAFSVAAWVKFSSSQRHKNAVISQGVRWRLGRNKQGGKSGLFEIGTGAHEDVLVEGTTNINDNQWHHLSGVYDVNVINIYIDGILEDSNSVSKPIKAGTGQITIAGMNRIKKQYWRTFLTGIIDDVRIYNHALSAAEVAELAGVDPNTARHPSK